MGAKTGDTVEELRQENMMMREMGKNSLLNKAWGVKGNKMKVAKVAAAKKRGKDGLTDSERALAYSYHVEVSQHLNCDTST